MSALGQLQVLIVEERQDYRTKLEKMLIKVGCRRIELASEGQEGLNVLQNHKEGFDLVVCNLDVGGMDGLEFIRHASRLGVGGLILYSKHDDAVRSSAEWMARAYKAPLLGVLGVPFNRGDLQDLVGRLHSNYTVYSDVIANAAGPGDADRQAVEEIEAALRAREFVPHYQPKICLATGGLRGAEVLARWEHPELGLLAPVHFVDLMENNGLIEELTHLVLEQAARHAVAWASEGRDVHLAINVSPLTLELPDCAKKLLDTIAKAGAQPSQFTFEITEKAFARDATTVLENVLRLRMKGCGIAVDDFGTGYSSLQQLNRTPITELKLDRSFVRRIKANSKALSIIESTLDLAAKLKLKTVAEGIDTEEQCRLLTQLGCHMGQGYLFSKALDRLSFEDWCQQKQRLAA
jgi:EAL domain-containing protein (putative c-di-GMP-specific phosphodiesterase class I)